MGNGLNVEGGSATVANCTFNNNGTAQGNIPGGSGLSAEGSSQVTITNSQLAGNAKSNLAVFGQAQVTAQGSTFSGSRNGDGAIVDQQASVNFTGDTFASNGTIVDYAKGYNGVEFAFGYSGSAVLSGNTFLDNTADGIFVGGSSQSMQITNNVFDGNLVGLNLNGSQSPVNAVVQGNTFTVPVGSSPIFQGVVAAGSGVTATIGGTGTQENSFQNYAKDEAIVQENISGNPHLTIPSNVGV
jgi:parallel beta-helix repeat protein